MNRMEGRVVVVTGAASGIGAGTARLVAAEGGKVIVADIQEDKGLDLVAELGECARFSRCDVTQEADIEAAVQLAKSEFGRLDGMVNNAGVVGAVGSITDTSAEAFDFTMSILSRAVFLGTKHAARVMVPQGSGAIVSLASTAGVMGGLGPHVYTMAKHGVIGLTKSAASELVNSGIRVNAVAPGNTVTAMTSDVIAGDPDATGAAEKAIAGMTPLGIAGMPSDIAHAIVYLLSDEARYVNGHTLVVDAGQTVDGGAGKFHDQQANVIREAGRRGMDQN